MLSELPAGRELDALVAERVMGQTSEKVSHKIGQPGRTNADGKFEPLGPPLMRDEWELREHGKPIMVHGELMHGYFPLPLPHYSTDIGAAWQVVEQMRRRGMSLILNCMDYCENKGNVPPLDSYFAGFCEITGAEMVEAITAPLAICKASLKAVEYWEGS